MGQADVYRHISVGLSERSRMVLSMMKTGRMPYIILIDQDGMYRINIGGESFGDTVTTSDFLAWQEAVEELGATNLVEQTGKEVFRITDLGYAVAAFVDDRVLH